MNKKCHNTLLINDIMHVNFAMEISIVNKMPILLIFPQVG
jgi:hypothetical protein